MEKKRFALAIHTLVIMLIALFVLAFLVLFFTGQSTAFFNAISGYSSETNVDSVVERCNFLVSTERSYEYCCEEKKVVYGVDLTEEMLRCQDLVNKSFASDVEYLFCEDDVC
jgi:hypothetical protein